MEKSPGGTTANENRSPSSNSSKRAPATHEHSSGTVGTLATELDSIHHRDFFQELMHRSIDALERNLGSVLVAIAVAAVGGAGWLTWGWLQARAEKSAQEAFYPLAKQFSEKQEAFERAKYPEPVDPKADPKKATAAKPAAAAAATGDLAKDYGSLIDDMELFAGSYKSTAAGVQSGLLAAQIRLDYNQPDRAFGTLKALHDANSERTLMGALVRVAEGNALAAADKCADALVVWQQVLEQKSAAFVHGEASLRAGICLETMGQKDRAVEMYKKAQAAGDRSTTAQSAKALLRRLEVGT